jgi:protein-S-isoprenylcysteine O-methyltransferase Ste14
MLLEERFLTERDPEYREYSKRTRRLIPFVV